MDETPEQESPLAPDKYPQNELFLCDIADAALKDIIPMMEHPFFSLSTKPDLKPRNYRNGKYFANITPHAVLGMPTILDKDLLIFVVSQVIHEMNQGRNPGRTVWINGADYLKFTNRDMRGEDYKRLERTVERLRACQIKTNVGSDGNTTVIDGVISRGVVKRRRPKNPEIVFDEHGEPREGRLVGFEIELSQWLWGAIENNAVLTINPEYFQLTKPIERRIYEIARKHCGLKAEWRISIAKLHLKAGSSNTLRDFKYKVKDIVETNHLPDYSMGYHDEKDHVVFRLKKNWKAGPQELPKIADVTLREASLYLNADEDIKDWYGDWLDYWISKGSERLHDADAAFLGWCKARWKYRQESGGEDIGFIEKHTDKSWREGL
jgi:hypothetical protein